MKFDIFEPVEKKTYSFNLIDKAVEVPMFTTGKYNNLGRRYTFKVGRPNNVIDGWQTTVRNLVGKKVKLLSREANAEVDTVLDIVISSESLITNNTISLICYDLEYDGEELQ